MSQGMVKWFDDNKGYGFVVADDEPDIDVFVHYSVIQLEGFKTLREGQRVLFETAEGPRGKCAVSVEAVLQ